MVLHDASHRLRAHVTSVHNPFQRPFAEESSIFGIQHAVETGCKRFNTSDEQFFRPTPDLD